MSTDVNFFFHLERTWGWDHAVSKGPGSGQGGRSLWVAARGWGSRHTASVVESFPEQAGSWGTPRGPAGAVSAPGPFPSLPVLMGADQAPPLRLCSLRGPDGGSWPPWEVGLVTASPPSRKTQWGMGSFVLLSSVSKPDEPLPGSKIRFALFGVGISGDPQPGEEEANEGAGLSRWFNLQSRAQHGLRQPGGTAGPSLVSLGLLAALS